MRRSPVGDTVGDRVDPPSGKQAGTPGTEETPGTAPAPAGTEVLVEFTVADNGPGIAPDTIDSIFATFSQGDSSTGKRYGGTGLGLAISRHIVREMDGELRAVSRFGERARYNFMVFLYVAVADETTVSSVPNYTPIILSPMILSCPP